jgi:hypothetical protein
MARTRQAVVAVRPAKFIHRVAQAIRDLRKTPAPAPGPPDRRRSGDKRIPCEPTKVRIAVEGEFVPVQAKVVNLSEVGVGLHVTNPYPLREGMQITIEMYPVLITGSIRYCTRKSGTEPFQMGVLISETTRFGVSSNELREPR